MHFLHLLDYKYRNLGDSYLADSICIKESESNNIIIDRNVIYMTGKGIECNSSADIIKLYTYKRKAKETWSIIIPRGRDFCVQMFHKKITELSIDSML